MTLPSMFLLPCNFNVGGYRLISRYRYIQHQAPKAWLEIFLSIAKPVFSAEMPQL